MIKEIK